MIEAGFIIICIGATMADSENLLIPIAVVALGAVMVLFGQKKEGGRDDDRA